MKGVTRAVTILAAVSILLSVGLICLGIRVRGVKSQIPKVGHYIVKGKLFKEPADIRDWVTPGEVAIEETAKTLEAGSDVATITKTYDYIEKDYKYEQDDLVVLNKGQVILRGGVDSWNLPVLTLAQKHQNGGIVVDCDDGTFLLVSLLRANGIDAWANIGTVTFVDPKTNQSSIYGHAWATVIVDGEEYLLETTLGEPLKKLQPVPDNERIKYDADVKFNEKDIRIITGRNINETIYPPLPPGEVTKLRDILNK